jgi:hypothetical protein
MENRSYAVGAGLFVLLLIALLIGGILWFDERGHLRGVPALTQTPGLRP